MSAEQTPSSGNVFSDLGFDPEEAANLQVRSDLMIAITETIRQRGLTQLEAAGIMGVTQPRVSDLMRGKINLFSIDGLIALASTLGLKVTVGIEAETA